MRLDAYVAEYWPEHSRSQWQKFIKDGYVQVNGKAIVSPNFELAEDDAVTVHPPKQPDFLTQNLPMLFQDENVVVINKPSGTLTHAKGAHLQEFTVASFMQRFVTDSDEAEIRQGIVHRLDRDTSGVLICARTSAAHSSLQKQFSLKKAKKIYVALVNGQPKEPEAIVRLPIERNPRAPATFRVGAGGKPAETRYKTLWTNGQLSLLQLQPATGRTHQLRVHMHYLGTPIVNDRFYNPRTPRGRLMLHAWQLEITIPGGERKTFTAPVPDDFKQLLPSEAHQWLPD